MPVKRGHNFYILACTDSIHIPFYSILNSDSFKLHYANRFNTYLSAEDNMASVLR